MLLSHASKAKCQKEKNGAFSGMWNLKTNIPVFPQCPIIWRYIWNRNRNRLVILISSKSTLFFCYLLISRGTLAHFGKLYYSSKNNNKIMLLALISAMSANLKILSCWTSRHRGMSTTSGQSDVHVFLVIDPQNTQKWIHNSGNILLVVSVVFFM